MMVDLNVKVPALEKLLDYTASGIGAVAGADAGPMEVTQGGGRPAHRGQGGSRQLEVDRRSGGARQRGRDPRGRRSGQAEWGLRERGGRAGSRRGALTTSCSWPANLSRLVIDAASRTQLPAQLAARIEALAAWDRTESAALRALDAGSQRCLRSHVLLRGDHIS